MRVTADDTADSPVAYQAGAKIAADKSASLVWPVEKQLSLGAEFRSFMDWTLSVCVVFCISARLIGQPQQFSLAFLTIMDPYGRTPASRKSWTRDE